MTDIFDLQTEFMNKAGHVVTGNSFSQATLYTDLVFEEFNEFEDCNNHDFESVKEACDVLVVVSGYLVSLLGTEKAKRAYDLVHASNMAKLEGIIEKREDGKVLKNDLFKRETKLKLMADLVDLVGGT